jgi:hypothetical protein
MPWATTPSTRGPCTSTSPSITPSTPGRARALASSTTPSLPGPWTLGRRLTRCGARSAATGPRTGTWTTTSGTGPNSPRASSSSRAWWAGRRWYLGMLWATWPAPWATPRTRRPRASSPPSPPCAASTTSRVTFSTFPRATPPTPSPGRATCSRGTRPSSRTLPSCGRSCGRRGSGWWRTSSPGCFLITRTMPRPLPPKPSSCG